MGWETIVLEIVKVTALPTLIVAGQWMRKRVSSRLKEPLLEETHGGSMAAQEALKALRGTWLGKMTQTSGVTKGVSLDVQFDFLSPPENIEKDPLLVGEGIYPPTTMAVDASLPAELLKKIRFTRFELAATVTHEEYRKITYREKTEKTERQYGVCFVKYTRDRDQTTGHSVERIAGKFAGYGKHSFEVVHGDIELAKDDS